MTLHTGYKHDHFQSDFCSKRRNFIDKIVFKTGHVGLKHFIQHQKTRLSYSQVEACVVSLAMLHTTLHLYTHFIYRINTHQKVQ